MTLGRRGQVCDGEQGKDIRLNEAHQDTQGHDRRGRKVGAKIKKMVTTIFSPNMLPNRRIASEKGRTTSSSRFMGSKIGVGSAKWRR